jgi:hypothetical protein
VKHGVDFPRGGETEFKGNVMDRRDNGEGAIMAGGEFGRGVGGAEVFALKPYKVTDLVGEGFGGG